MGDRPPPPPNATPHPTPTRGNQGRGVRRGGVRAARMRWNVRCHPQWLPRATVCHAQNTHNSWSVRKLARTSVRCCSPPAATPPHPFRLCPGWDASWPTAGILFSPLKVYNDPGTGGPLPVRPRVTMLSLYPTPFARIGAHTDDARGTCATLGNAVRCAEGGIDVSAKFASRNDECRPVGSTEHTTPSRPPTHFPETNTTTQSPPSHPIATPRTGGL
jgi:hypothetical protein